MLHEVILFKTVEQRNFDFIIHSPQCMVLISCSAKLFHGLFISSVNRNIAVCLVTEYERALTQYCAGENYDKNILHGTTFQTTRTHMLKNWLIRVHQHDKSIDKVMECHNMPLSSHSG